MHSGDELRGRRAVKVAAHDPHHRFGAWGRLPHLQLNTWRVGVKGSGLAVRVPRPSVAMLFAFATVLLPRF